MKKTVWVVLLALLPSVAGAQTGTVTAPRAPQEVTSVAPVEQRRSQKLMVIGGLAAGTAGALLLATLDYPADAGETFTYNHQQYCVDSGPNHYNVDEGGCWGGGRPIPTSARPYFYAAAAAGVGLFAVGFQKVKVRPMVSRRVAGAQATISWGGNAGRQETQ
jgi:hypothetical protein